MDLSAQGIGCRGGVLAGAAVVIIAGCQRSSQPYEYIHLPGTEPAAGANMPFTSAIRVRSGSILFLSGTTGAPVPHSHPPVPAEFDHLDCSAEAQTIRVMERLKPTLEAAGGQLSDIIQVTRFIVDVANNQDAINVVMNRYWGDDHRPASTSVEIVRLASDPPFILAVEAVAVLSD